VGERVSVGHRVVLHGARIDDDVLVGMGSVVMNGAHIGSGCIVAAGAVVTQGKVYNAKAYSERLDGARRVRRVER
jgi:carbonic anhydrase/acetyltransferase-like protein (isoleucine patch superfamily)